MNWKQRKQLGLDKEYKSVGSKLKKERDNLQTRDQFKEFAKGFSEDEATYIEVGEGDFEMSMGMMEEIQVCEYIKKYELKSI